MKYFKLIILMSFISSIFFVSCGDDEVSAFIVEDEVVGFKPTPYDPDLFEDVKIPIIDFSAFNKDKNMAIPRGGCLEYINAIRRLDEVLENCKYDKAYCAYLQVSRQIAKWIYQIDCLPDYFCGQCESYIISANELRQELIDAGLHPLYISDIDKLIERLESLCSSCE